MLGMAMLFVTRKKNLPLEVLYVYLYAGVDGLAIMTASK